jgi:hypothetical protein
MPDTPATPASVGNVLIEVNPTRIDMQPGETKDLRVKLQNLSHAILQFQVAIIGIDADWYTAPTIGQAFYPQDVDDDIRITLHPPGRGVRGGSYPMRIVVRSESGGEEGSVPVTLDLLPQTVYRLDLVPLRQRSHGNGNFRLQVTNTGNADARVEFEGLDTEDQCRFRFPKGNQVLAVAGTRTEAPVVVQPKSRPWVGPERGYSFSITARPVDARGESRIVTGQYSHQPRFASLPIWGFLKVAGLLLVALILLIAFVGTGTADAFGNRVKLAHAQLCGHMAGAFVLGALCPGYPAVCGYTEGFQEFAVAKPDLVGACVTNVEYDEYGNGLQVTRKGDLFWLKASNTVYFFVGDTLYAFIDGQVQKLDGSGPSNP